MKQLFNDGWKFYKLSLDDVKNVDRENIIDPKFFADYRTDENKFIPVKIPHDWMICNVKALYEDSVGFYKKEFNLISVKNKRSFIRFEGAYMNYALYVNGKFVAEWKYGYSTVEFEISDFVTDGKNIIALVMVYQSPNSRWYSGAGIFRDVYFIQTGDIRIGCDGIYFSAEPSENFSKWKCIVQTEIDSKEFDENGLKVFHKLTDAKGNELKISGSECRAKNLFDADENLCGGFEYSFEVENPMLWSGENPNVYVLETVLCEGEKVLDSVKVNVGFRKFELDCDRGFFVNGKHVKLNGVCEHHDFGGFGSAFNLTSLKRKFVKLRKMGVNAIRCSHNPQDTKFLDLADLMGFYIISECFDMWEKPKTKFDYGNYFVQWHKKDCARWVRKDRNHPCNIMWSIGNEIYDTHSGNGFEISRELCRIVRVFDPNKNSFTTIGSNYMEWDGARNCANNVDAVGYNYLERLYKSHHEKNPHWCIYGSETSSTVQSRGIYHFPLGRELLTYSDNQCSSLGNCTTNWGAKNSHVVVTNDRDTEFSLGQFIWTGFDYIGEPTPYFTKNSFFGQLDTAGFAKDTFYVYKANWVSAREDPFVHILPYWDFNEGQKIDVRIYSNLSAAELFVNGKSFGKKDINVLSGTEMGATWKNIIYSEGSIKTLGYDEKGKCVAQDIQKSFGNACKLEINLDYADDGYFYFDISSLDDKNNPVCNSRSRVEVCVEGAGELKYLDNGDSSDYEEYVASDNVHNRKLFSNHLLAVVYSETRSFTITASGLGLKDAAAVFADGKFDAEKSEKLCGKISGAENSEVPVRKIQLELCDDDRDCVLTRDRPSVKILAKILPENASYKNISCVPMMAEGIKSDAAVCTVKDTDVPNVKEIIVSAVSDGDFILSCTQKNNSVYDEIISEMDFSVKDFGKSTKNPYQLIEGCRYSSSDYECKVSFAGGIYIKNDVKDRTTSFVFEGLDFGKNGADAFSVFIFSFENDLDFEVYEGSSRLASCHYSAPSIYNVYQKNEFVLEHRLFGIHSLTFRFSSTLSFGGFEFAESSKAFARLNALDCSGVTGDSFVKKDDGIYEIGNNVALEFDEMIFGDELPKKIKLLGKAYWHNTIHLKFSGSEDSNCILEFPATEGFEEKEFDVCCPGGVNKVSFIFLPGSRFDFRTFEFIRP